MSAADPVREYYARLGEHDRLSRDAIGRLEYVRTRELLSRLLPPAPASVLDVGGATGVHAQWIAAAGYRVLVIDPEPSHVEAAAALPGVDAAVGDARALTQPDAHIDAVLLLGPLYHLPDAADRYQVWREAVRVARPGAVVVGVGIVRTASLLDYAAMARLDASSLAKIERTLATGRHDPTLGFTDAYFHTPDELAAEATTAGLADVRLLPVEGPGAMAVRAVQHAGGEVGDDLLDSCALLARVAENRPELLPSGSHLLAVGRVPRMHQAATVSAEDGVE